MYCPNPGNDSIAAVRFTEFPGPETLRVAVTGDMPPIDYLGADGEPAGYNTAIIAELGRCFKVSIKPVHVDTAERTAALVYSVIFSFTSRRSNQLAEKLIMR